MVELYSDISQDIREEAKALWLIALAQKDAKEAAKYLNNAVEVFRQTHTEEEVDFIQFYFETQMEMRKG